MRLHVLQVLRLPRGTWALPLRMFVHRTMRPERMCAHDLWVHTALALSPQQLMHLYLALQDVQLASHDIRKVGRNPGRHADRLHRALRG